MQRGQGGGLQLDQASHAKPRIDCQTPPASGWCKSSQSGLSGEGKELGNRRKLGRGVWDGEGNNRWSRTREGDI